MKRQGTEALGDSEATLCDTMTHTFVQTHRLCHTKSECYVKHKNYGLTYKPWVLGDNDVTMQVHGW